MFILIDQRQKVSSGQYKEEPCGRGAGGIGAGLASDQSNVADRFARPGAPKYLRCCVPCIFADIDDPRRYHDEFVGIRSFGEHEVPFTQHAPLKAACQHRTMLGGKTGEDRQLGRMCRDA
ncbi:hypothetical protein SAMN03159340_01843 [Sphingomonas sp. NFR15]|nr:hypothetical protein SAMN03159340_01843 [Sphingomonas sp. NFR15]